MIRGLLAQWALVVAMAIVMLVSCLCGACGGGARAPYALGSPACHAHPEGACRAMLTDAFPDTPSAAWSVLECGDLGVLGDDGTDVYAVTSAGDVYKVEPGCGWTLLATTDDY